MPWTDEMVEELKRLWAEGVTTGEIGRRLNISKNSIVGKVHRLGLSGRPSPIKRKEENVDKKPAAKQEPATKEKKCCKNKDEKSAKDSKPEAKPAISSPKPEPVAKTEAKPEAVPIKKVEPMKTAATQDDEDIKLAKSMGLSVETPAHKGQFSLTDLDNHTCRWPIGDPKDENFHFCGKKVRIGQTYCEEHAAIAYVRNNKK